MRTYIAGVVAAVILAAPALAADKADIMAVDSAFSQMSMRDGVAAAFSHYLAPDAIKLDGGAHAVIGHDEIMKGFEGLPADFTLEWWPQDGRVAKSGELAYTWGVYELSYTDADGKKTGFGKYTTIWELQDGEWKAILDTGNPSPGPAPH